MIKSKRQNDALTYAINQIQKSPVFPYVAVLYLYGSCARGEEKFRSDVDLFMELREDFPVDSELKTELIRLKSDVSIGDIDQPETDLKIVIGNEWKNNKMLFYKNVRKEGIQIWL